MESKTTAALRARTSVALVAAAATVLVVGAACGGGGSPDGGSAQPPLPRGRLAKDAQSQVAFVSAGKGVMPSFSSLGNRRLEAVIRYEREVLSKQQ